MLKKFNLESFLSFLTTIKSRRRVMLHTSIFIYLFFIVFMIPWDIPTSDEEIPRLTHIYRNQHFLVWLAAMDLESKVNLLFL